MPDAQGKPNGGPTDGKINMVLGARTRPRFLEFQGHDQYLGVGTR